MKHGFIVDVDRNELEDIRYAFNKSYFNDSTLSIAIMPSMACNFSCPYCFEAPYRKSDLNPDYFSVLKLYADKNFKFYNHVDVNLFGGEPLLFFEEILDYLEYVEQLSTINKFKFSSSIITNGSLVTANVMKSLKRFNCNSMQITIDGCKRTHDITRKFCDGSPSFDSLIDIINSIVGPYLNQMDLNFTLRFNLLNNKIEEIKDSLNLIEPKYRNRISVFFRSIYDTSCFEGHNKNSVDDYYVLLQYAKKIGYSIMYNQYFARSCEACSDTNFGYITSDLSIWKCLNAKGTDQDFGKVGHIEKDGTVKFDGKRLIEWYKAANCFNDEKCMSCPKLPDCLGGCIAYHLSNPNQCRKCSEFNLTSLPFLYK